MDKRRYVSRNPRNPREPKGMGAEETGNAAADGYTVRHRQPLERNRSDRFAYDGERSFHTSGLKDEDEARWGDIGDY